MTVYNELNCKKKISLIKFFNFKIKYSLVHLISLNFSVYYLDLIFGKIKLNFQIICITYKITK